MDELRKALDVFALRNAEGEISDAVLEKACEAYKARSEDFADDYSYNLYVAKSVYDHIHGIDQDPEIAKAIMPGQTKVVNGVVYIWTLTPNAKTTYDWRVYKTANGQPIGKGAFRSKAMLAQEEKQLNEMFPADPSDLTYVQDLGGSTGAKLMKDSKGREFVVKSSKNTSRGHVAAEYYAAQVYDLLGLDTPEYEMYDDGTDLTLISPYMRGMSEPQAKDYDAMPKASPLMPFWPTGISTRMTTAWLTPLAKSIAWITAVRSTTEHKVPRSLLTVKPTGTAWVRYQPTDCS